jgi:predicted RNA binding protein YcfA (HicA-like mRNA interferase family)
MPPQSDFSSGNITLWERAMKIRDIIKRIETDGWLLIHQVGSHRQYKHPTKRGKVTVAGHPSTDLPPKTLKSILRQAGLEN